MHRHGQQKPRLAGAQQEQAEQTGTSDRALISIRPSINCQRKVVRKKIHIIKGNHEGLLISKD